MSDDDEVRDGSDELSSIPNLISSSSGLGLTEQSGPLSLSSELTSSPTLQDPQLDYDDLELTQVNSNNRIS